MRHVVNVILSCAIAWLVVALFWPWAGPLIVKPCPLFTPLGVFFVIVVFGVAGGLLGRRML